ncbi:MULTISPECIES: hypothetical protein [unclassified Aureimonas]|uniref:hypothetical protein n=1 Tax=unclassified Aureimonas TaxID=2615206 RepID=UPI00178C9AEA|nr:MULTISPECIES: hypothetical protein [unclassified Aureimonas]
MKVTEECHSEKSMGQVASMKTLAASPAVVNRRLSRFARNAKALTGAAAKMSRSGVHVVFWSANDGAALEK